MTVSGDDNGDNSGKDVDPIIGEAVGSRLKSLFDECSKQEVPGRFLELIEQLEKSEKADNTANSPISPDDAASTAGDSGKADT